MNKTVVFNINHHSNPYDQFNISSMRSSRLSMQSSHSSASGAGPVGLDRSGPAAAVPPELPTGTYRPPIHIRNDDTRMSVSSRGSSQSSRSHSNNEVFPAAQLDTTNNDNNTSGGDQSLSGGSCEPIGSGNSTGDGENER